MKQIYKEFVEGFAKEQADKMVEQHVPYTSAASAMGFAYQAAYAYAEQLMEQGHCFSKSRYAPVAGMAYILSSAVAKEMRQRYLKGELQ